MFRTNCLVCNSENLESILDLGMHPLADTFLKAEDLAEREIVFPLIVDLCLRCGQVQLKCVTNPDDRYSNHEYSYTSSNSPVSRDHWREYTEEVLLRAAVGDRSFVIEIGSNDGYLSEQFLARGHRVLGVDPSPQIALLARGRGVRTEVALFSCRLAKKILEEYGAADLIVANNVFNHADNPREFVRAVAALLKDGGTFVFQLPYWLTMVESKKFDQIYHEHVSYFTVNSSEKILRYAGMQIYRVEFVDYLGGSIRVFARRSNQAAGSCEMQEFQGKEHAARLFDAEMYKEFQATLLRQRARFLKQIYSLAGNNETVIAAGAAAKGNTLLNFCNLDHKTIKYITDSSELKRGKYTPYSRIPITDDSVFAQCGRVWAVILAWNISEHIQERLLQINPNVKFISPWEDNIEGEEYLDGDAASVGVTCG
jgi:SAM-dependent methyltransferase